MADQEMKAIGFSKFGGLRLDQALDEVGAEASIYEHDIERDGSTGRFRSRDGFQKLNASPTNGEYKGLYPHSPLRLLATKRVSATKSQIVALDKTGTEKVGTLEFEVGEAPSTFASVGTNAATYTFARYGTSSSGMVRFDGSAFLVVTATIENVTETGEKEAPKAGKAFPLCKQMVGWPDASDVLVLANTFGTTGGPNGAASSNSHVWFSKPGAPEAFEETAFIALGVGDGEEITGLCVYAAQLYVFKETKFWVVSPPSANAHGQPEFSFREVSLGQGTHIKQVLTEKLKETSDRICWASQDGVFFCTTDGIYQTTGSQPSKLSQQLKPLEETVPFEGPMAEFLNGSTESFRWPATGITVLGKRIYVKRYEFIFIYDLEVETWTCWKMPSVSMAIWTGLTGGGSEIQGPNEETALVDESGVGTQAWTVVVVSGKKAAITTFTAAEQVSHYVKATNFGFAIPSGATILGIELSFFRASARAEDNRIRIIKGGTIKETQDKARAGQWTEEGSFATYGGEEDLWGNAWTPSDINATNFGFALSAKSTGATSADITSVKATIYYVFAEATSGVRPRLFCSQTKTVFWNGPNAEEEATFPGWAWQSGLYDLGSEDEKVMKKSELWGAGNVKVATSKDFKALKERHEFQMGEETTRKMQNISDDGVLFSHRLEGTGKASIQKFVRYLATTKTAGSQSNPS